MTDIYIAIIGYFILTAFVILMLLVFCYAIKLLYKSWKEIDEPDQPPM